ncbi:MAG TPA: hypothetical protein GX742_01685 [Acholeplasmataceae bacterium]|nr:hypothetical protein [Acholeplasmataceae bacterium]
MKKFARFLEIFIRASAILLIGINLFRMFDKLSYFNFLQEPIPALLNSILLLIFGYFRNILKYFKLEMSELLYSLASISIILTFQIGMIFGVYQILPGYDSFAHFANGGLLVLVGLLFLSVLVKEDIRKKLSPLFIVTFAFCFAGVLGVLWEIFEYLSDGLVGSNMQRFENIITGEVFIGREALNDTMKDFILNTIGGVIASLLIYFDMKKDSPYLDNMYIKKINNDNTVEAR